MPLTDLVKDVQVRSLVAPLLSTIPMPVGLELKAPLRRKGAGPLVGTAFDYAVRFELQRRYPNAVVRPWVAEAAMLSGGMADLGLPARWQTIVHEARSALAEYLPDQTPSPAVRANIVTSALRLARIDPFYRIGYCDPEPERVEAEDLADVLALLEMAPWERLGSPSLLWLNPSFGSASSRVGGADADIIANDELLDLKTTSTPTLTEDLRQLLGYLVLARAAHEEDPSFPVVSTLGVYHGRHGHLWTVDATTVVSHAEFAAFADGLFKRADELAKSERSALGIEKVATPGLTIDTNSMYYVKDGAVWRVMRRSAGATKEPHRKQEKVAELNIKMDGAYDYFVDRDGDVSRRKALHPRADMSEWSPVSEVTAKVRATTKVKPKAKAPKKASAKVRATTKVKPKAKAPKKVPTKVRDPRSKSSKKKATSAKPRRRPQTRPARRQKSSTRS